MANQAILHEVSLNDAVPQINVYMDAGLVSFLRGSPGVGKSDIVKSIAAKRGLKVIDLRLSQCDPTDLNGFPQTDGKKGRYLPMETFPLKGETIPDGFNGWLLFLDEITSAPPSVQAAAYKLVLDRQVGLFDLHPDVYIMAAGNKESDNAVVHEMSTALRSRLAHIDIKTPTVKEWSNWAMRNDIDHRVVSFLNFMPDLLYKFNAEDSSEHTFPCPRTWEFVSRAMKVMGENIPTSFTRIVGGLVGNAAASQFSAFIRLYQQLPQYSYIVADPQNAKMPTEPGAKYAVAGMIANKLFTENDNKRDDVERDLSGIMNYVERMEKEYQVVSLKTILAQGNIRKVFDGIGDMPEHLKNWAMANAEELFGD